MSRLLEIAWYCRRELTLLVWMVLSNALLFLAAWEILTPHDWQLVGLPNWMYYIVGANTGAAIVLGLREVRRGK